jgi:Sec-independent protein translocase protein TatA
VRITVGGLALFCLVLLLLFGNGRLRMLGCALCGAVIGGVLTTIGEKLISGAGDVLAAVLNAFAS